MLEILLCYRPESDKADIRYCSKCFLCRFVEFIGDLFHMVVGSKLGVLQFIWAVNMRNRDGELL